MVSNYYSTKIVLSGSGLFIGSYIEESQEEIKLDDLEYKNSIIYQDNCYDAKLECLKCFTKWDGYRNKLSYKCPFCGNKVNFERKIDGDSTRNG